MHRYFELSTKHLVRAVASKGGADGEAGDQLMGAGIALAVIVVAAIIVARCRAAAKAKAAAKRGTLAALKNAATDQTSKLNTDLKGQLDKMKHGVHDLTHLTTTLFADEFAKTIGDNTHLEEDFAALEIDRSTLTLSSELGKGAFGIVYLGTLTAIPQPIQRSPVTGVYKPPPLQETRQVAVKMLLEGASSDELTKFLCEGRLMSLLKHPNLLELVAVLGNEQPFFLITELMEKGDLKEYLRSCRPDLPDGPRDVLTERDLL